VNGGKTKETQERRGGPSPGKKLSYSSGTEKSLRANGRARFGEGGRDGGWGGERGGGVGVICKERRAKCQGLLKTPSAAQENGGKWSKKKW